MPVAIHQLLPSFKPGDAMGQAALHFRWLLGRLGHRGHIYAGEVDSRLVAVAQPFQALRPQPDDWVLYHHGIASELSGHFIHLPCRRSLVFHNVTPSRFYQELRGTPFFEALEAGRAQLAAMAPFTELGIGVSRYNAAELSEAGFGRVETIPLTIEPERFTPDRIDRSVRAHLEGDGLTVVTVSRVVPHKRMEDLLSLHAELLRLDPRARLLVVGGYAAGDPYFRRLKARADSLPGVRFLGRLSHGGLVAAYRASHLFVSMSEHEGFGVPLIEAMACELPVMAFAAAAVAETLGGSGIAFSEKRFALLAELARELGENTETRHRVLEGQRRRLKAFAPDAAQAALGALFPLPPPRPRARALRPGRRAVSRPRIGLVISRFGAGSGGAERHAQAVATQLGASCEVRILTTRADDHLSWKNVLPEGEDREVPRSMPWRVHRFGVARARRLRAFNALSRSLFGRSLDRLDEERWISEQGPDAPALLDHLERERDQYDAFIFFQYLYAPTVFGLPLVAKKALLVPTAHEEPFLHFQTYRDVFALPRKLLCNTVEEERLIRGAYPDAAPSRVVGVGVEAALGNAERFRERFELRKPYVMYVGRVEGGKGIPELLAHHRRLWRTDPERAPELVLAGLKSTSVEGPGVRYLGPISERDKQDGLRGALATVVPSRFESLSLLALESFAQGTPILANDHSDVLRGQVERSGAGALYRDAQGFAEGLRAIAARRDALGAQGRAYALGFTWKRVIDTYRSEIRAIMESNR